MIDCSGALAVRENRMRLLRLPHDSARKQRGRSVEEHPMREWTLNSCFLGVRKLHGLVLFNFFNNRFQKRSGCNIRSEICVLENR